MTKGIISYFATSLTRAIGLIFLAASGTAAHGSDYPVLPLRTMESGWSVTFTPYAWLISLNGTQTVRGRTVDIDETFFDIVHDTIGKGGQLFAAMAQAEARHGPFAFFGDVVWEQFAIKGGGVVARNVRPGITAGLAATGELRGKMAIAEAGAAYEIARFGLPFGNVVSVPAAFDVLAGARYWYQQADVSLDVAGTLDIADLVVVGRNRAIARSGSVDWVDPFVGARLRLALAPGHEIIVRGDVGGFDVGSQISWQAIGGYAFDFAVRHGITFSGLVGYKALYVDYQQGEGRRRYEFDMLQHGPVLGLSLRW
jgi:hypothetical protein